MYVEPNFKTKAKLKAAVQEGKGVTAFSPGPFICPQNGWITVEGPHYPKAHSWYAEVRMLDGYVVAVK